MSEVEELPRTGALVERKRGGVIPAPPQVPPEPRLDQPSPSTRVPMLVGLVVCIVFFGGFMLWSFLAPLAEAAIAPGVIKVEGTRRTLSHLEGGIVREILVRDGTKVKAGDVVMRLDQVQADTTAEAQRATLWGLLAQDARLSAEAEQRSEIAFPDELRQVTDPRAVGAMTGQRALFEARTASLNSQLLVLRARVDQQSAIISGARGQLQATYRQLALIRQEEAMRRGLVQQGLARLPDLLAVQRSLAGLEGQVEDQNGQIVRAQAAIDEAQKQMQQVQNQRRQEVGAEQSEVRGKLSETRERLRAAADVVTRRDIVAPDAGVVVNLRQFTIGGIVRPGDAVMDLVPDSDRLVAEVNVSPTDIDVVIPGLVSEIRLPAFKQRLVPYLHGHVTWVAADVTTNEQTRQQYYRAYIAIDDGQLGRLPNVFLTPGMPVEGHIKIAERSFFRYLTQPIRDSFHRAFREQ
jgi:HlyD family type I secretion membrane fusion protein